VGWPFAIDQQSLSVAEVQPVGQQWSAAAVEQVVIGTWRQAALQVSGLPTSTSAVHGSPSSGQVVGQVLGGSQVSPFPTWPSPQTGRQSESLVSSQPTGQQPSSLRQATMARCVHPRVQFWIEPLSMSVVQASPSSHLRWQAPGMPAVIARSHFSLAWTTPSPQMGAQSESVREVQPAGQHLSPPTQAVIGV